MRVLWWSRLYTWLGWITGTILQDGPWREPSLESWLCWSNFYSLLITLVEYILYLSLTAESFDQLALSIPGSNKVVPKRLIFELLFVFYVVLELFKRGYFWANAKRFIAFKNRIEAQQLFKPSEEGQSSAPWKFHALAGILVLVRMSAGILSATNTIQSGVLQSFWFGFLNTHVLNTMTTVSLSFLFMQLFIRVGFVTTTTRQVFNIFNDFCDELESAYRDPTLPKNREASVDITGFWTGEDKVKFKARLSSANSDSDFRARNERLIWRMTEIRSIFKEYDSIYGPLLLCLIVASFLGILNGANSVFDEKLSEIGRVANVLTVASESFVLFFMEMGHRAHQLVWIWPALI
jgi:hypothetical protein